MSDLLKLNNIVQRNGDIKAFPLSSNMKSTRTCQGSGRGAACGAAVQGGGCGMENQSGVFLFFKANGGQG